MGGLQIVKAEEVVSPSMQAYKAVSVAREKHDDVIWQNKPASPAELQVIIKELNQSLIMLDQPLYSELAEGNLNLRYRRFNILVDLVKLYARTGDNEKAFSAWNELNSMQWEPEISDSFTKDPNVTKLMKLPEFKNIKNKYIATAWWSSEQAFKTGYHEQLPVEERIAGLSRIWAVAREGFVWFDHVPELNWDKSYLEYLPKVIDAKSTEDYYRVLQRFVVQLKDGHSNVYFPEALENRFYARPGLRTRLIEGKVIITRIADAQLEKAGVSAGDEVLAIDGIPVRDYARDQVTPYESSSTPQDVEVRAFAYALLVGDADKPVKLSVKNAKGNIYQLTAPRSGYKNSPSKDTELFELRADDIAVLRANQFENDATVKALESNLNKLMGAKGFVIDLRGNGGGSSGYGLKILSYLSAMPITLPKAVHRENNLYVINKSDPPAIRWRTLKDPPSRANREKVFQGPVVMLIDARSFSAAEDTAAIFKWMKRGKIMGSPSGGSTGQPLMFALPGGGSARICIKRDTYPDGSDFVGTGVLPDVKLEPTIADFRSGSDSVLENAVAVIKSGSQ